MIGKISTISPVVVLLLSVVIQNVGWSKVSKTTIRQREEQRDRAYNLLMAKSWDELEGFFDSIRGGQHRICNGETKISWAFRGITPVAYLEHEQPDAEWLAWYERIKEWGKARPGSKMVPIAKMNFWIDYACKARGNGYSHTVSKEGWELFGERLAKAEKVFLQSAPKEGAYACPLFYKSGQNLALVIGWDEQQILERVTLPFVQHYPWAGSILRDGYGRYLPKWGGRPDSLARYVERTTQLMPEKYKADYYVRCMHRFFAYKENLITREEIDFELYYEGVVDQLKKYPKEYRMLMGALEFSATYLNNDELATLDNRLKKACPIAYMHANTKTGYLKALKASYKSKGVLECVDTYIPRGANEKNFVYCSAHLAQDDVTALCVSSSGVILVRGTENHVIARQDRYKGLKAHACHWNQKGDQLCVAYSAMSGSEGMVIVYDWQDGRLSESCKIEMPRYHCMSVRFREGDAGCYLLAADPGGKKFMKLLYCDFEHKKVSELYHSVSKRNRSDLHYAEGRVIFGSDQLYVYDEQTQRVSMLLPIENGKRMYDFQLFDRNKHCVVLLKNEDNSSSLCLYRTADWSLIKKMPFSVNVSWSRYEKFIEVVPTPDQSRWTIISTGYRNGVSQWSLQLGDQPSISLEGYEITNAYMIKSLQVTRPHLGEFIVGQENGMCSVWKCSL